MDLPREQASEPNPDSLASLAARVADLEREVAALRSEQGTAPHAAGPEPAHPIPPAVPREFQPLPPLLQTLLPAEDKPPVSPALPPPKAPAAAKLPGRSFEDKLGSQVFNRVGIVALLVAASWGLKLAFENQLIGATGRIVIGLLAGAGLVLWSERFRRRGFAAFSWSLKAVGSGVLYLTLWAAFQLYALLPAPVALALMIAVTAWNAYMAWAQDSELLAAYALSGAFATPLLLSTGGNHEVFLFTYLLTIDLATLLLVRLKPWPRLLLSALTGTILFYGGWYLRFYTFLFATGTLTPPFVVTTAFVLGFAVLFALASVRGFLRWTEAGQPGIVDPAHTPSTRWFGRSPAILSVLVPLLNAAFLALALSLLVRQHLAGEPLPWLMVALAVVYLGLVRVQRTATAAAMHLALAVIFLTIAIPLKASGHTLTIAWFAEALALFWVSTRTDWADWNGAAEADPQARLTPVRILRGLALVGYTLGLLALVFSRFFGSYDRTDFFSADLLATLFAAGTFAAAAWLALRPRSSADSSPRLALFSFAGVAAAAVLLALREFEPRPDTLPHAFLNADFASALVALALLAGTAWASLRMPRQQDRPGLQRFAAGTFVLFNLLAILSIETEINALWHRSDANLQRSLAISGFLMLYGAVLLTVGFVRRSAFTRWQALVLLLFTILKVFLYDISSLSQGYRVLSFLALGVLLMAVSFAYQKDWLGLKSLPAAPPVSPDEGSQ